MSTMTFFSTLQIETCCHENCKMKFAMDQSFYEQRRGDHKGFYCPRGHLQFYTGKSDEEKLQQEVQQQKEKIERLEQARVNLHTSLTNERIGRRNEVRAQKAAKTRMLNRVKNGTCPCCNRSFANLHNHFKSKHPELLTDGSKT